MMNSADVINESDDMRAQNKIPISVRRELNVEDDIFLFLTVNANQQYLLPTVKFHLHR